MVLSNERRPHRRRAGMTLLEVMISLTIFATAMAGVVMSLGMGGKAYSQSAIHNRLYGKAGRAMQRLVRELGPAVTASILPVDPDGGDRIQFQSIVDSVNGAPVLGEITRFTLEMDPREINNGLDDDGDGLVDEQVLVRLTDPLGVNEKRVILLRNVREFLEGETDDGIDNNGNGLADEPGVSFDLDGELLTIRLTVEAVLEGGRVVTETLETSMSLRN